MYSSILRLNGHDVTEATDGLAGLRAAQGGDFDLVLLDLLLPRLGGLEVLKALTEDSRSKGWPVVILTNLDDPTLRSQAFTLGAREYVLKSEIVPRQLAQLVPQWALTCG